MSDSNRDVRWRTLGTDSKIAGLACGLLVATAALGIFFPPRSTLAGPVHEAAREGDLMRVERLIRDDPTLIRSRDALNSTPLDWAAFRGHRDVMVFLLDQGADPNAADDRGRTPLLGVEDCRKDLIELLESRGADVRAKSQEGWTALHWAAQCGREDSAAYLLSRGLDVNARCADAFGTPLTMAAANGSLGVAKMLLAKGADVNARASDGTTPLHTAASHGETAMVKFLLDHHAEVNALRAEGARSPSLLEDGELPSMTRCSSDGTRSSGP